MNYKERLFSFYRQRFELKTDYILHGKKLIGFAENCVVQEKSLFFSNVKTTTSEARECVLFFECPEVTLGVLEEICSFVESTEPYLVDPNPNHAFSLLSAVILTSNLDKQCLKWIKKYQHQVHYKKPQAGWSSVRLAVVETAEKPNIYVNSYGSEIKNVLREALSPLS